MLNDITPVGRKRKIPKPVSKKGSSFAAKNSKNRASSKGVKIFPEIHSGLPASYHTKSLSLCINAKKVSFTKEQSRNLSSSLNQNLSAATTHASKNSKSKGSKNSRSSFNFTSNIQPFTYFDQVKKEKTEKEECLSDKENDFLQINNLFVMQGFKSNLNKYNSSKRRKKIVKKLNPNKLIFNDMYKKYMCDDIKYKTSRDKTMENEAIEAKKMLRFWKGVFDYSYPRIIIESIKEKYSKGFSAGSSILSTKGNPKRNKSFADIRQKDHQKDLQQDQQKEFVSFRDIVREKNSLKFKKEILKVKIKTVSKFYKHSK